MGLLEESIPEQYICYICRDPPGKPPPHAGGRAPPDLVTGSVAYPLYKILLLLHQLKSVSMLKF